MVDQITKVKNYTIELIESVNNVPSEFTNSTESSDESRTLVEQMTKVKNSTIELIAKVRDIQKTLTNGAEEQDESETSFKSAGDNDTNSVTLVVLQELETLINS